MLTHLIGFAARPQAAHVAHRIQRIVGRCTERLQLPLPLQPATRAAAGGAGAILPTAPDAPEPHGKTELPRSLLGHFDQKNGSFFIFVIMFSKVFPSFFIFFHLCSSF